MPWPKGKPRKSAETDAPAPIEAPRVYRSVKDLVALMSDYKAIAGNRNRGLFADCELDIYRMFLVHHNDEKAIADIRPTGCSDRIWHEWELRFRRAFGELQEAA